MYYKISQALEEILPEIRLFIWVWSKLTAIVTEIARSK
jgi:hypothetical protein